MFEPNATVITVRIREGSYLQVQSVLERYGVSDYDYLLTDPINTGDPAVGRYEVVITDAQEVDAQKLAKSMLRAATGYQPPDSQVIMTRAYVIDNA